MFITVATNITITCNRAGADGFFDGPGDDIFMEWKTGSGKGENSLLKTKKLEGNFFPINGMFDREIARTNFTSVKLGVNYDINAGIGGEGDITFTLKDKDEQFFDSTDDLLLQTTYKTIGNEPLFGAGSFYFVNFSDLNGSKYKLEYNINKFSISGKVASVKGGVMNGRNTDGTMVGLGGQDTINGNNGDDLILGGGNNDLLDAGKGNDVIFGGKGIDRLRGGKGNDTLVMARGSGSDKIQDFLVGEDHLGLANGLTFQDLSFVKVSSGTLIKAGSEKLALLQGIDPNQLSASSFVQSDLATMNSLVSANLATIKAS